MTDGKIVNKALKKNFISLLSGSAASSLFLFFSMLLIARGTSLRDYGIYVILFSVMEVLNRVLIPQSWVAYVKFATEEIERNNQTRLIKLFNYSVLADFLGGIAVFLMGFLLIDYVRLLFDIEIKYSDLSLLMLLFCFAYMGEIYIGVLRVNGQYSLQVSILTIESFLKFFVVSCVYFLDGEIFDYALSIIVVQILCVLIKIQASRYSIYRRVRTMEVGVGVDREYLKRYFHFLWFNNLNSSLRVVSRKFDIFLIGSLISKELVAVYSVAVNISNIFSRFCDPVYQLIYPRFAVFVAKNDLKNTLIEFKKIIILMSFISLIAYLLYYLFAEFAIELLYGDEYLQAYTVGLVYLIAVIIAVISMPITPLMNAIGLVKEGFYSQLISTVLYMMMLVILVNIWGVLGAALAYILYYLLWVSLCARYLYKEL